jgi:hypothetical protein
MKKKLPITNVDLIMGIRRPPVPVGKPFKDKKRQSKLDKVGRKAKYKSKDI